MNRFLLTICMLVMAGVAIFAQTSLEGKVTDKDTGEPIIFGQVVLFKNGVLVNGTDTDEKGNYFFSIDPGTYDIQVEYVGYSKFQINGVQCSAGKTTRLPIEMDSDNTLEAVVIIDYKVPLIEIDNTTQGSTVTSEKIEKLGVKNINAIAATSAGVQSADGSTPSIRGSRSNETVYFIDGIRTSATIPQSEVEQLQLVTGGIEARYGDVSGGVISLTSKGPSQEFSGGVEAETSEFLDGFGYNLYNAYVSGPLLKNSKGRSVLGFRFSGQYTDIADGEPSAVGVSRAPLSIINQLEANPFYTIGASTLPSAERLKSADVGGPLHARPTDGNKNLNVTGKIDAKLTSGIDVTFSGNYEKDSDQFSPDARETSATGAGWNMFNWHNNPFEYTDRLRLNFRFRHKLDGGAASNGAEKVENKSLVRNISYTLLAGFERGLVSAEDLRHKDKIFDYGYFGLYPATYEPVFGRIVDANGEVKNAHLGFLKQAGDYVPNAQINPVLSLYNNFSNGINRSELTNIWSNIFSNVGQVYNRSRKTEDDLYTFNFSVGADLVPKNSDRGRHSLQFGVLYEQSISRSYSVSPFGLWRAADLLQNAPLSLAELDSTIVMRKTPEGDTVYAPVYEQDIENTFFINIRKKLNASERDFVNVHSLTPDQLSLDMFSARELSSLNLVDYRGYDYLGNKTVGNITFEDFFTARDDQGRRTHPVAPFSPIYAAGYIQDKFSYKDIIFRLGLRADYYDANTKVFKDPYAPYEIESAEQYFTRRSDLKQPASVGNDYKVYVSGDEDDAIKGYRVGDQWYKPNGEAVSNGTIIHQGGVVYPSYVGKDKDGKQTRVLDLQDPEFKTEYSFDDYKPQLNFMPRLAFSFPISQDAGFFAHYDVLYQRPPSNSTLTALDYFYWNNASDNVQNNPNLKPVRTVSYEAGFQQKLSKFSALKLSAYYKENKDLIQQRVYAFIPAPIGSYETFGNLDFGTTKGFSFTFDKRRSSNLEFSATYTIQFADGSGSDANSSNGINKRGILRNLNALSFDERHRFTGNVDFRYSNGKAYDGPTIAGVKILENTGINLNGIAVSGQPFTRNAQPSQFSGSGYLGAINGSRLPWNFTVDGRIDRNINLKLGSAEGARELTANVYLRGQNIFNTLNVKRVFGFTGDPQNDGYLNSAFGLDRINDIQSSGRDVQSFLDTYSWGGVRPGNYFYPRRLYLGIIFNL